MLNVNTIALLRTITGTANQVVNVLGYYIYNGDGGGRFYWNSASTATDDGGSVIQATGVTVGRWLRIFNGFVSVKYFGAVGNDTNDDTSAITNAWNYCQTNVFNLNFPEGTYKITSTISNFINGYSILGIEGKTIIKGSFGYILMQLNNAQNGGIYNIKFVNNYVNSTNNLTALLYILNCSIINFTIDKCIFNAQYCNVSAIVCNINANVGSTNQIDNFKTTYNTFENIGNSAYIMINKNNDQTKNSNVVFNFNFAKNLGLLDANGYVANFQGSGQFIQICNNDCTDAKNIGVNVELYKSCIISNNIFNNDNANYYKPYVLNGTRLDNLLPVDGNKCELNIISNNVCNNTNSPYYYYIENCNINSNIYVFDSTLNVNVVVINSNNNLFSNEQYISKFKCVTLTRDISNNPSFTCLNNMFSNCIFTTNGDNSISGTPNIGITFIGGANNNFVNNSNFILGDYTINNVPIVQTGGSTGNLGSNNIFNDVLINFP
jgi:hypothetical protein